MEKFYFVADEMGTPGMSPGVSNTFVFGGFVINEKAVSKAIDAWNRIKHEMCGDVNVELKWKHFFVDENDNKFSIPLKVKNKADRKQLAALALEYLFRETPLFPLIAISRKDRATDVFIVKSSKGKDKIDYDVMWVGPIGMFATFLALKKGKGKLIFDKLSTKQEKERQESWSTHLDNIRNDKLPKEMLKNFQKLLAIDEKIDFLDSIDNEIIQIADFICGVIWRAGEGNEDFLIEFENEYGKNVEMIGLGIMHIG